jgi:hypothetical protein
MKTSLFYTTAAILLALAAPALADPPATSKIVTTDGHLCAAGTVCSPINAGESSKAYLDDANTTEGSGYIAIQFGPNPSAEGYVEFLLSSASIYPQTCVFSPGHTTQGIDWPVASQIEWWSTQLIGTKYAVTVKYRSQDLQAGGVYAFAYACSPKTKNPPPAA